MSERSFTDVAGICRRTSAEFFRAERAAEVLFGVTRRMDSDTPTAPALDLNDPQQRNVWFTSTPDPWEEIVRMSHGGDRSHGTVVERRVTSAESAQHAELEQKLIAVLERPELTGAGRLFVCRMLGLIGSEACVPVVARLLESDRTADHARLALDGIADPTVDAAYRGALDKLHGAAKAGLIGSIAMRGDGEARGVLSEIAKDERESSIVRTAAKRAMERLERMPQGEEVAR